MSFHWEMQIKARIECDLCERRTVSNSKSLADVEIVACNTDAVSHHVSAMNSAVTESLDNQGWLTLHGRLPGSGRGVNLHFCPECVPKAKQLAELFRAS